MQKVCFSTHWPYIKPILTQKAKNDSSLSEWEASDKFWWLSIRCAAATLG